MNIYIFGVGNNLYIHRDKFIQVGEELYSLHDTTILCQDVRASSCI